MNRPAHIAPLDAALKTALNELAPADERVRKTLDTHIAGLDAVDKATTDRANAYSNVRKISQAITSLGYSVLPVTKEQKALLDKGYSLATDKEDARTRLGLGDTK